MIDVENLVVEGKCFLRSKISNETIKLLKSAITQLMIKKSFISQDDPFFYPDSYLSMTFASMHTNINEGIPLSLKIKKFLGMINGRDAQTSVYFKWLRLTVDDVPFKVTFSIVIRHGDSEGFEICVCSEPAIVSKMKQLSLKPVMKVDDIIESNKRFIEQIMVGLGATITETPRSRKPISDLEDLYERLNLHQKIKNVSGRLFCDGHYAQAILEAFKEVEIYVKEVSKLDSKYGKDLMANAFKKDDPKIKFNHLITTTDKDEQEGLMMIYMGAVVGIRNPKAHDIIEQKDPYLTLHYLSFASLLIKRIELVRNVWFTTNESNS